MRAVLHVTTRPEDALALAVLARQSGQADLQVDVVDLTVPAPDYEVLLERIFAADSIQVW
jgi:hypothetical protein